MDRSFVAENTRARARLEALVARLSEQDLGRPVGDGWTVADTLVHLAFWDLRAVTLIGRVEQGRGAPSPVDVEIINATVATLGRAIPPRAAARLAVEAATAVVRRLEALPDHLLEALVEAARPFNLSRHLHWAEHLDAIERALSPRG